MKKGILLPIFSLPSKLGQGNFGYEAFEFIDILSNNNITYWQILPINACKDSPYSPISYYALNEAFISFDKLKDEGLIKNIKASKENLLQEAFNNFKPDEEYYEFIQNNNIYNYSKYMEYKTNNNYQYYLFIQYILFKQWMEIKKYANSKHIKIIGDMPMYPDYNSQDIYFNKEYFQLSKDGNLEYVSGAPSDESNPQGQKWNHPLYDYKTIKDNNYEYLLDRYKYYELLFDLIRIDYFKGYESYYKIPINKSANDGFYEKGPSYDFFDKLFKFINKSRFIVEDLGDITQSTKALKKHYNLMGMKILQYDIDLNNIENNIIYTGNHDNNTIIGWFNSLNIQNQNIIKNKLLNYNINPININKALIQYIAKKSNKNSIIIIPVQDIIGLSENCRINIPGVVSKNNWSWHLGNFNDLIKSLKYYKEL